MDVTCMFTQAEEEYLRTYRLMTLTHSNSLSTPHCLPSVTPQQRLMYTPVWPAVQSGPLPPMPQAQPAPSAPFPMPPAPVTPPFAPPAAPPQNVGYAPGSWGPMPNYPHNRIQSVTLWARGHPTSSTTQVHMVTAMRTPKRLSPTSSLV